MSVPIVGFHNSVRDTLVSFGKLRELTTDETLGRENGVFSVGHGLTLGGLTNETFPILRESNHRRSGACAFRVFEDG